MSHVFLTGDLTNTTGEISTKFSSTVTASKYSSWVSHLGAKSAIYDCLV